MAGHSKWANIQYRKGAQDKKRASMFAKLSREIMVAAKIGGPDPDMNPRLRLAMANARSQSMPKANIENAVKKGAGGADGDDYVEMRYEGYGPGGVAIIVDALTDNKNRTAGDVRAVFNKYDGNMGETNSVSFMFDRVGEVLFEASVANSDDMFEGALDAGAMNVESGEEIHEVICEADDFSSVRDALEEKFGEPKKAGLSWRANVMSEVNEQQAQTLLKLVDALEEHDDVQHVTTNFEVDDETLEKLMAAN